MTDWRPFWISNSAKFVIGYHCVRPSILFYIHGLAILQFF